MAVGSDDPASAESSFICVNLMVVDACDDGLPVKAHAECDGAMEKEMMEYGARNAAAAACREGGFGGAGATYKTNAAKGVA
jgi:hypothetical protein